MIRLALNSYKSLRILYTFPKHSKKCSDMMMSGAKGKKAVHACMIRLFTLGPAKHEEVAIYVVNLRSPNVCRIAEVALATKQFVHHHNNQAERT